MCKLKIHFFRKMLSNINIFIRKEKKKEKKRKNPFFCVFFFSILLGAEKVNKGRNSTKKGNNYELTLLNLQSLKGSHSNQKFCYEI